MGGRADGWMDNFTLNSLTIPLSVEVPPHETKLGKIPARS